MYDRIIKNGLEPDYFTWIKENNFSISSPRHRGLYAENVFRKFCNKNNISVLKLNPLIGIFEQIPPNFLKKIQEKELKKLGKIKLSFFCIEKKKGYFALVKMGTSTISSAERDSVDKLHKNKAFLFRVFEDAELFIKKI